MKSKIQIVMLFVIVVALAGAGCKTRDLAKVVEAAGHDPAEVHLVIDRNGLKLDRTNPNPNTNTTTAAKPPGPVTNAVFTVEAGDTITIKGK